MPDPCVICGCTLTSEAFWQKIRARSGTIPIDQSTYGPMCPVAAQMRLKPQVTGYRLDRCPQAIANPETAA